MKCIDDFFSSFLAKSDSRGENREIYIFKNLAMFLDTFVSFDNAHFFSAFNPTEKTMRSAPKIEDKQGI